MNNPNVKSHIYVRVFLPDKYKCLKDWGQNFFIYHKTHQNFLIYYYVLHFSGAEFLGCLFITFHCIYSKLCCHPKLSFLSFNGYLIIVKFVCFLLPSTLTIVRLIGNIVQRNIYMEMGSRNQNREASHSPGRRPLPRMWAIHFPKK